MPVILELTSNFHNRSCSHHEHNPAHNSHHSPVCGAGHGHIGNVALHNGHNLHSHIAVYNHLDVSGCGLGHDGADKVGFHSVHNSVRCCPPQCSVSGHMCKRWADAVDLDAGSNSVHCVLDYRRHYAAAGQKLVCRTGGTPGHFGEDQNLIPGSPPLH